MTPSSHDAFADGAPPPARESTAAPVKMELESRNDDDGNANVAAGRSARATIAGEVAMKEGLGNATVTRMMCQNAAADNGDGVVSGDGVGNNSNHGVTNCNNSNTTNNNNNNNNNNTNKSNDLARKVGVGLAGSALIVAGVPLIPLPGPGDFMVAGGLALLATEFPAAQRVVDGARDALASSLGDDTESSPETYSSGRNADEGGAEEDTGGGHNDAEEEEHGDCDVAGIDRHASHCPDDDRIADEIANALQNGMEEATANAIRGARWFGRHAALPLLNKIATDRSTEAKNKHIERS